MLGCVFDDPEGKLGYALTDEALAAVSFNQASSGLREDLAIFNVFHLRKM
jgi:hypothetical protein